MRSEATGVVKPLTNKEIQKAKAVLELGDAEVAKLIREANPRSIREMITFVKRFNIKPMKLSDLVKVGEIDGKAIYTFKKKRGEKA